MVSALFTSCLAGLMSGEWDENVIYSFQWIRRQQPHQQTCWASAGNLYGTTSEGGSGRGTIFKLSPLPGGQWVETVVDSFQDPQMAGFPQTGMVVDRFGNFYGATVHGGKDDDGSVYKFTP